MMRERWVRMRQLDSPNRLRELKTHECGQRCLSCASGRLSIYFAALKRSETNVSWASRVSGEGTYDGEIATRSFDCGGFCGAADGGWAESVEPGDGGSR